MRVVIDRSKWLRGEGEGNSFLYRSSDNKMCCLGFYSLACGYDLQDIKNIESPAFVVDKFYFLNGTFRENNLLVESIPIGEAMEINDDEDLSEERREELIKERFSELGIEVEFVDGE